MTYRNACLLGAVFVAGAVVLPAQDSGQAPAPQQTKVPSDGWRKFDRNDQRGVPPPASAPSAAPDRLTVPAGTWITVRTDQGLSSDHNLSGDAFTATLTQPVIANGYVVARRGQTIGGRVVAAVKGGRVKGTSRLAIELTELTLADGQQTLVRTQFINQTSGTSHGRDAGAIATTTGVGAAIGAAADGGFGAGMGAIAGAAASTIGVLATRGHATEIYPESTLTFRLTEAITVNTANSSEAAFQAVRGDDYEQRQAQMRRPTYVAPAPQPYFGGYYGGYPYYSPYYSPFYFGSGIYFRSGPRFYGGHGYGRHR